MKFVKTIREVLDRDAEGIQLRGEVNAVIAVNVDERQDADTDRPRGQEESDD